MVKALTVAGLLVVHSQIKTNNIITQQLQLHLLLILVTIILLVIMAVALEEALVQLYLEVMPLVQIVQ